MASSTKEVAYEHLPFIRVYKDGTVERLKGTETTPPSTDPITGVQSKDIVISPETGVAARLYLPKTTDPSQKHPILIYFHGGGFVIETTWSPTYHNYLNKLVHESNVIVVSVEYRRAPEHPLPIAYDDSWDTIQWITSHGCDSGSEPWLKEYADFNRVFLAGDSAGANIAHNVAVRAGLEPPVGLKIVGIALVHPYFWGIEAIGAEKNLGNKANIDALWMFACPSTQNGCDDPWINPAKDPNLGKLGCSKVLICVAEKDFLRDRGFYYKEKLGESGWGGVVEIMEAKGEQHVFHLFNPTCDNARAMLKLLASFLN